MLIQVAPFLAFEVHKSSFLTPRLLPLWAAVYCWMFIWTFPGTLGSTPAFIKVLTVSACRNSLPQQALWKGKNPSWCAVPSESVYKKRLFIVCLMTENSDFVKKTHFYAFNSLESLLKVSKFFIFWIDLNPLNYLYQHRDPLEFWLSQHDLEIPPRA